MRGNLPLHLVVLSYPEFFVTSLQHLPSSAGNREKVRADHEEDENCPSSRATEVTDRVTQGQQGTVMLLPRREWEERGKGVRAGEEGKGHLTHWEMLQIPRIKQIQPAQWNKAEGNFCLLSPIRTRQSSTPPPQRFLKKKRQPECCKTHSANALLYAVTFRMAQAFGMP